MSGNLLPKVKIRVECSFFSRKFFSQKIFWSRTMQIGEDCLNVYIRSVKVFRPKCKTNDKFVVFPKKNICHQTKIWTGKMMLLPFLPKELSSKSDKFKIHRKRLKTYWKDFDTVFRQLWENWLNPFVWSAKTFLTNLWKKLNSLFFKQFSTPIFCSRNEKWILWNACREKPLKVWKRLAQS